MTQILIIAGTVGKDAELRYTQGGDPILGFSIAVDNGKDKGGNRREATWYEASIWGARAQGLAGHITKGTKLTLTGRPTVRVYNEKAYPGISVDQLTFQGGPKADHVNMPPGFENTTAGEADKRLDDEIPF